MSINSSNDNFCNYKPIKIRLVIAIYGWELRVNLMRVNIVCYGKTAFLLPMGIHTQSKNIICGNIIQE